jgi:hypothetical protein
MKQPKEQSEKILNWFNKHFELIVVLFLSAIVIVIISYIVGFSSNSFSSNPEHWGQLGDYFGGLLNPIIAIANLAFLIYLTLLLKQRDDQADKKALETQSLISLNQFRNDAYLNLIKVFQKADNRPMDSFGDLSGVYLDLSGYLIYFKTNFGYLFETEDFEKHFAILKNNVLNLFQIGTEEGEVIGQPCMLIFDSKFDHYRLANNEYLQSQYVLIKVIQHIILNKPFVYSNHNDREQMWEN